VSGSSRIGSFTHWQPRPGTTDAQIIDHVYTRNCYGLPDDMRDYVVIDVGAHVGAFTIACLDRGARVLAFEPDLGNYRLLLEAVCKHEHGIENSALFLQAVIGSLSSGVWMTDSYPVMSGLANTGGKNIFNREALPEDVISTPFMSVRVLFAETLNLQLDRWGYTSNNYKLLLKLDCEGSEHQIIEALARENIRPDHIIGEAHDATNLDPSFPPDTILNAQSVVRRLSQLGYRVRYKNCLPKGLALFSAARRAPLSPPDDYSIRPCPCGEPAHTGRWCERGLRIYGNSRTRILWVGDAVAATGFSRCTHAACDALRAAGYEVHILGINYYGDPHSHPYPIYPARKGGDWSGVLRLPELVERIGPDLIIGLNDAWNVKDYLDELDASGVQIPPIMFWLAADAENQSAGKDLEGIAHVVGWTQFALDEFKKGGYRGPASIVPLGVDTSLFRPLDKQECRAKVLPPSIPPEAFIVGFVGRNQPRKRIDLLLRYFATWLEEWPHRPENQARDDGPDAYLYLHVAPTGERGTDIRSLVRCYGLEGRVIVSHPPIGEGVADAVLPLVYNSMDLFLTTTQGEGWGLPVLEAIACGVLCAVPNWSALGEWARPAAYMIPCTSTNLSAPLNGKAYTIGGVPDERETVNAIQWGYEHAVGRGRQGQKYHIAAGLELARSLSWEKTGERMVREVEKLLGILRESAKSEP